MRDLESQDRSQGPGCLLGQKGYPGRDGCYRIQPETGWDVSQKIIRGGCEVSTVVYFSLEVGESDTWTGVKEEWREF